MNGSWGRMALALVLSALLLHDGVVCQEEVTTASEDGFLSVAVTAVTAPAETTADIQTVASTKPTTEKSPEDSPTTGAPTTAPETAPATVHADVADPTTAEPTALETTQTAAASTSVPEKSSALAEKSSALAATSEVQTDSQQTTETVTSAPAPAPAADQVFSTMRPTTVAPTDAQTSKQTPASTSVPQTTSTKMASAVPIVTMTWLKHIIQCVGKEAVSNKDAVKLELKEASSCEDTKEKMKNTATDLCEEDCKLYIFQEENSNIAIVTGQNIEGNVMAMADKFSSELIKDKLGLTEVTPQFGGHPPTVLVTLLICGLLLAALLIGGYVLKQRRNRRGKGIRLAEESYQADEENQVSTLVSVAPLTPPEHQQKPSVNGESPKGVKIEPPPVSTNGHSNAKAPMADTEL